MASLLPHLKARPADLAPLALVCGDPARARRIAEHLTAARHVGSHREYETFTGEVAGVAVTVSSHGVGAGGAAVCCDELIQGGVRTLVRLGTCGSLQPQWREGALLVVTGAVRRDGASDRLVPCAFPAVADWRVVGALDAAARAEAGDRAGVGTGLALSEGVFYPGLLPSELPLWIAAGVLAIEMECSLLFTLASIRGVRSGALLNVDNYVPERTVFDPHRAVVAEGTERMIRAAIRAVPALAEIRSESA
jgi:uridine phosphorylase